jgi:hypothetical protein
VASAITKHFKETDNAGQIVFATHAVLSYVRFWANKRDWHVFIDEDIQVLQHHCHQLPQTHQIITDHIELEPIIRSTAASSSTIWKNFGRKGETGTRTNCSAIWPRPIRPYNPAKRNSAGPAAGPVRSAYVRGLLRN